MSFDLVHKIAHALAAVNGHSHPAEYAASVLKAFESAPGAPAPAEAPSPSDPAGKAPAKE